MAGDRTLSAERLKLSCKRPPERSEEGRLSDPISSSTALEIVWFESCMLRNPCEHFRTDLLAIVERESIVRSTFASESSMRTALTDHAPSDTQQCGQHGTRPRSRPLPHPNAYAAKDTLLTARGSISPASS